MPVDVAGRYRSDRPIGSTRDTGMTAMRATHVARILAIFGGQAGYSQPLRLKNR